MSKLPEKFQSSTEEILHLHGEIENAARSCIDKAIRIGELLVDIKAGLKHGDWLPWLKENVSFDRSTAANYMRLYERRDEIKCRNVLHLTDAYRLLAAPSDSEAASAVNKRRRDFIIDLTLHIFTTRGLPVTLSDILALRERLTKSVSTIAVN